MDIEKLRDEFEKKFVNKVNPGRIRFHDFVHYDSESVFDFFLPYLSKEVEDELKTGDILIATNECVMNLQGGNALIIDKEYIITEVMQPYFYIESEVSKSHSFDMTIYTDWFKLKMRDKQGIAPCKAVEFLKHCIDKGYVNKSNPNLNYENTFNQFLQEGEKK